MSDSDQSLPSGNDDGSTKGIRGAGQLTSGGGRSMTLDEIKSLVSQHDTPELPTAASGSGQGGGSYGGGTQPPKPPTSQAVSSVLSNSGSSSGSWEWWVGTLITLGVLALFLLHAFLSS